MTSPFKAPTKQAGRGIALLLSGPKGAKGPPPSPPDSPNEDSEADESGETCNAKITGEQLQELQESGTVELQGDDGEKVVLTMDQGEGPEQDEAPQGE